MTGAEAAFEAMLDEYAKAITASHLVTPLSQRRIEQARLAILQDWQMRVQSVHHYRNLAEALGPAGDRLAHEMLYAEHRDVMEAWWQARGGHHQCSVCNPAPEPAELAQDKHQGEPVPCGCVSSDAWRCGRERGEHMFVTCQCACHRPGSHRPARAA